MMDIPECTRRDTEWQILCVKYAGDEQKATAVYNLRKNYKNVRAEKESKKVQVIHSVTAQDVQKVQLANRPRSLTIANVRCSALTMQGKQCPYKASCGKFCRRHSTKTALKAHAECIH